MRTLFLIFLLSSSAFALTPAERKIAEGMAERITSLKADLAERTVRVDSLTSTLAAQSLEVNALSADLRTRQQQIDALVAERDSLKESVVSLNKEIASLNERIVSLTATVEKVKLEAKRNARERDVIVFAFAIAFAALVVRVGGPLLAAALPQYSLFTGPLLAIGGLAGGYALGRIILRYLSHLIP